MSHERSAEFWRGVLHGYHGSEFLRYDDIRAAIAEAEAREASVVTKERWIEMYGGQTVLDREGMEVVPCVDCTDAVCHGWMVRRKTEASVPTAANGTGTLTLSETIAGLREACAGVTVSTVAEPTEADLAVADELDMLAEHIQEYVGPDDARDDIRRICRNRAEDLRRGVKRGPSAAEVIEAAEEALEMCRLHMKHNHVTYLGFGYDAERQEQHEARVYVASERPAEVLALIAEWKAGRG